MKAYLHQTALIRLRKVSTNGFIQENFKLELPTKTYFFQLDLENQTIRLSNDANFPLNLKDKVFEQKMTEILIF